MATNPGIDQILLKEAVTLGRHRSKKAAVTEALQESIARHKQQRIVELFGTVDYCEDYDYYSVSQSLCATSQATRKPTLNTLCQLG